MESAPHEPGEPLVRGVLDLQRRLTETMSSGVGLRGVADVLWQVLGRPAAVWTGKRRVSMQAPPGESVPQRPGITTTAPLDSTFHHAGWLWHVVQPAGPESRVIVGIADPEWTAREHEYLALGEAAAVTALEVYRMQSVAEAEVKLWGGFWEEIFDEQNRARVRAHAEALGFDTALERCVALIEAEAMKQSELLGRVQSVVRLVDKSAIVTQRDQRIVAILGADADWSALARLLREAMRGVAFGAGVSSRHQIVDNFATAMREAEMALRIRSAIGGRVFTHFDDLGVYRLLAANGDTTELDRYVQRWLGTLLKYDRERNSELVRTLSEYLEAGRSVDRAADALFIHPSTLKYRLGRIRKLVGANLSDSDVCFNLQLAIRTLATVRALGPGPADNRPGA